jgi:serine/threonine protein kinase
MSQHSLIVLLCLQSFKQMIASCLVKDPSKRPSAKKLLKHSFFKQARSNDYIARTLLEGLPALGDRIKALKVSLSFLIIMGIAVQCYFDLYYY